MEEDDLEDLWREYLTRPQQVYQHLTRDRWWWGMNILYCNSRGFAFRNAILCLFSMFCIRCCILVSSWTVVSKYLEKCFISHVFLTWYYVIYAVFLGCFNYLFYMWLPLFIVFLHFLYVPVAPNNRELNYYYYYYYYHHYHYHHHHHYFLYAGYLYIHIFLRQTMSLGNKVFQLFCHYYLWCLYR